MPFGFFGWYALRNRNWPVLHRLISLSILATILSAFVEFLQMFTIDRNTSDTDLITNTLGAIVGIVCAVIIKPSSIQRRYANHVARFTHAKALFPFIGITLVTLASAFAPFDFGIDRGAILDKIDKLLSSGWSGFNKKDFVVFLYFGSLLSFTSALCFKQWRIKYSTTMALCYCLIAAVGILVLQPFIASCFPGWGCFTGTIAGIFFGLPAFGFVFKRFRGTLAWVLVIAMASLLLYFNFAPTVQSASKLGSFLRFSSRGTQSLQGLVDFIQITAQFIPVGFIMAYLYPPAKKRLIRLLSLIFLPVLATPLLIAHHWGFPSMYDVAVLVIAEVAVFIGAEARLWAWPVFNYYCREYEDR
jgi:glycopeptide antibiotics resistance protein